jgi:hypothetical protein
MHPRSCYCARSSKSKTAVRDVTIINIATAPDDVAKSSCRRGLSVATRREIDKLTTYARFSSSPRGSCHGIVDAIVDDPPNSTQERLRIYFSDFIGNLDGVPPRA